MNILIDTHAFMWFVNGDAHLGTNARQRIENPDNTNYMSVGSLWEIAIKINIGKLTVSYPYDTVIQQIEENEIELLPIKFIHTQQLIDLPLHHRNPFDRLIIAQAMAENMVVVTKDENFNCYPIEIIWQNKSNITGQVFDNMIGFGASIQEAMENLKLLKKPPVKSRQAVLNRPKWMGTLHPAAILSSRGKRFRIPAGRKGL